MGSKRSSTGVALSVAIALYAACGGPDESAPENGSPSDTMAAVDFATEAPEDTSMTTADPSVGGRVYSAELEALGGTDVIGSVSLRPGEAGTAVTVEIHGANSGLPYVAELVAGSCGAPAAVIALLGQITAGAEGDGEFHEVLDPSLLGIDQPNRFVRVRGAGDTSAVVACGDLADVEPSL